MLSAKYAVKSNGTCYTGNHISNFLKNKNITKVRQYTPKMQICLKNQINHKSKFVIQVTKLHIVSLISQYMFSYIPKYISESKNICRNYEKIYVRKQSEQTFDLTKI
jgi:hypothetical protein